MKKHARQIFIRANARRKKHTECITEYSCGVLRARCVRIVQAQGRILVVEHYRTGVKMFKNINYSNSRGVSIVQTQSSTDYSQ